MTRRLPGGPDTEYKPRLTEDGKTFDQEAHDTMTMLGVVLVMIFIAAAIAGVLLVVLL